MSGLINGTTLKTNIHDLIKQMNFSKDIDISDLKNIFFNQILGKVSVDLEVVGYVKNINLVKMIEEEYILPQNSILNGKTKMDATNYYLQSGFFREISIG